MKQECTEDKKLDEGCFKQLEKWLTPLQSSAAIQMLRLFDDRRNWYNVDELRKGAPAEVIMSTGYLNLPILYRLKKAGLVVQRVHSNWNGKVTQFAITPIGLAMKGLLDEYLPPLPQRPEYRLNPIPADQEQPVLG